MIGEPAAERWTNQVRDAVDDTKDALPFRAFRRGEDVANDGEDQRDADARAQSLHSAKGDQFVHGLRRPGQRRTHQEDDRSGNQKPLAPKLVGELANGGDHDNRGQRIGRDSPGIAIKALQRADDTRERGTDDSLVQCLQQKGEH